VPCVCSAVTANCARHVAETALVCHSNKKKSGGGICTILLLCCTDTALQGASFQTSGWAINSKVHPLQGNHCAAGGQLQCELAPRRCAWNGSNVLDKLRLRNWLVRKGVLNGLVDLSSSDNGVVVTTWLRAGFCAPSHAGHTTSRQFLYAALQHYAGPVSTHACEGVWALS
jgi:hypothetical protein